MRNRPEHKTRKERYGWTIERAKSCFRSYVCIALVLVSSILRIRWLSAAGLGVLAVGLVLMLAFCKCPHCGAHMRLRERKTGYCPACGKRLED